MAAPKPRFLSWDLTNLEKAEYLRDDASHLKPKAKATKYPFRGLRYWHGAMAVAEELKRLGPETKPTVIDFGCHRGTMKMMTPIKGGRWVGVDIRLNYEGLETTGYDELHEADMNKPFPLADNVGDIALALHIFEHLPELDHALRETHRVLKPGGALIIGTPILPTFIANIRTKQFQEQMAAGKRQYGNHIWAFSPKIWRERLEKAGFEIEYMFGAHFFRKSGFFLENHKWWVRVNHAWGIMFPALGREIIIQARAK